MSGLYGEAGPQGIPPSAAFGKPDVYVTGGVASPREEYRKTRVVFLSLDGRVLAEFVGPKRWREVPQVGGVVLGETIEVPVTDDGVAVAVEVEAEGFPWMLRQTLHTPMPDGTVKVGRPLTANATVRIPEGAVRVGERKMMQPPKTYDPKPGQV